MKKKLIIVICLFSICFCVEDIKAYTCYYDIVEKPQKSSSTMEIYIEFNTEKNEILSKPGTPIILDEFLTSSSGCKSLIESFDGKCPEDVTTCTMMIDAYVLRDAIGILFNSTLVDKIHYGDEFKYYNSKNFCLNYYSDEIGVKIEGEEYCAPARLNKEKSDSESIKKNYPCDTYDNYYKIMENNYCNTQQEKCDISEIQNYNNAKDKLKNYCNVKLQYGYQNNKCVTKCLGLSEDLSRLEGTTGSNDYCGFSERLISFIGNILKWVKYIVPVIVIVLGILDFIKALSSDNDDAMKKAQGKFMKRLIAAALVFIIPLIIEFILNKMGFDYNECGLF